MTRTTNTVGAWLPLALSLVLSSSLCAAPSAAPSPGIPGTPARNLVAKLDRANTYRILAVEPDADIDEAKGHRRRRRRKVTVRPRAIRIKFEKPTTLWRLRGAVAVQPEVEIDWDRSEQVEDTLVKLVGKFERNRKYEFAVTGYVPSNSQALTLEKGRFPFELPASLPAVEFANLGAVLERESKQLVHLKMRDVEKVRLAVTELPLATLLAPITSLEDESDDDGATKVEGEEEKDPVEDRTKAAEKAKEKARADERAKVDLRMNGVPVVDAAAWSARAAALAPLFRAGDGAFAGLASGPVRTETDLFPEPGPPDKERRCSLPLTWRESKGKSGTFVVSAEAVEPASPAVRRLVQITDLALSTKTSPTDLTVWVTRLSTGQPVAGAQVYLGTATRRVWAAGKTSADGLLRISGGAKLPSLVLSQAVPKIETADLTLAGVERVVAVAGGESVWDANPEGEAVTTPPGIKVGAAESSRAHVFTERGVYRPGDTVNFHVTARKATAGSTAVHPAGTLCQVLIENPRGQVARVFRLPVSEFGTVSGSFPLKAHEPLGQWSVEVRSPTDAKIATTEDPVAPPDEEETPEQARERRRAERDAKGSLWGETTFRMEEYVPPRHRVEVSFKEKTDGTERAVTGVICGVYYAGGPVKHGKVRWRVTLTGTRETVPGVAGYTAGIDRAAEPELLDAGEATLDATGSLAIDLPLSGELADGRRGLSITATVLDFDSRTATGEGAWSSPPKFLVGISDQPARFRDREPVDVKAVVVERATGKPVQTGELTVAVLRRAHTHVSKRNEEGDFYEAAQPVMIRAFEWRVSLADGLAPIHLEPSGAGEYALEVGYKAPDGTTYHSSRSFQMTWSYNYEGGDYCYESSDHMGPRWYADRLHALAVTADRGEYTPGETARIYVRAPRPPVAMILAIERERGLEVRRITPGADGMVQVKIPDDWTPNVYVSVLASYAREGFPVYPTDADTLSPSFGHGYLSLPIRKERAKLEVGLKGAGPGVSALPGAKHSITVTVKDASGQPVEAEVALAAVDEAVLSLTGFATPTLEQLFEVGVPLGVTTHDSRRGVSLQTPYRALTVRPLTGGDGGDGRASKTRENFNPVACWQPALRTDASGQATAEFTLPDAMTAYRVYAVAVTKGDRHGAVARPLTVKKPFYLEAGLPRFFTQGDRAKVFVAVFNETGKPGQVSLKVTAQGGLAVKVAEAPVPVGASDRVQIPVEVEATHPIHTRLEIEARLGEHVDRVVTSVPVRERTIMRTYAVDGVVDGTASTAKLELPAGLKALSPGLAHTGKVELALSPLPALRLVGGLRYLLQYPYGCIEQTSSRVLPLAVMRKLAADGMVPTLTPEQTDPYLTAGITRLASMQTESGGFGYWPGDRQPHPWGSAYATFALWKAKQAGAEVPAEVINRARKYLAEVTQGKNEDAAYAAPFAHYVLAVCEDSSGAPDRLAALAGRYSLEERLFLWMAAARAGMRPAAREGLRTLLAEMTARGELTGWQPHSFWTWGRTRAVALLAVTEIDPEMKDAGQLAMGLFRSVQSSGHWNSTQETAWSLIALAATMGKNAPAGEVACGYSAPGATAVRLTVAASRPETVTLDPAAFLAKPEVELSREGSGLLVYRLAGTYPYEGPEVADTARIKRTYRRLAGDGPIRVGDLVEVSLVTDQARAFDYAALVDPLPAGLAAVNSALKSEPQPINHTNQDDSSYEFGDYVASFRPTYLEIRDDRVAAFRNYGWHSKYRFTYVARATCEGTFVVPPAKLEPMYQPEESWYSQGGTLEILPVSK